jgi:phosphinothricin acetyltransferase
MAAPHIRPATAADLEAVNAIYNHYVLTSTATYQTEPELIEARRAWFAAHDAAHPVLLAELDGQVLGWGSLSPFHDRAAYAHTVENSVYVHQAHHRRGIGAALLQELLRLGQQAGHRTVIAAIDSEQAPSVALHRRFEFVPVGRLQAVGYKFGRWLDVIYMQRML